MKLSFLLAISIGYSNLGLATSFNEEVYYSIRRKKCAAVSTKEIEDLSCKLSPQFNKPTNLASYAESFVFTDLAEHEKAQLDCSIIQTEKIIRSRELQEMLLVNSCAEIPKMRRFIQRLETLETEIARAKKRSNYQVMRLPREEAEKEKLLLQRLEAEKRATQAELRLSKEMDVLLSSPSVSGFADDLLEKRFFKKEKDDATICSELKKKLPDLLQADVAGRLKAKDYLENQSEEWLKDDDIKSQLWQGGGKEDLIKRLTQGQDLSESTVCRMEALYGDGKVHGERMKTILSLGIGGAVFATGKLAALAFLKKAHTAYKATRALALAEFAVGGVLTGDMVYGACKDKLDAVSTKKSCQATSHREFKNLLYKQVDANACLKAKAVGAIFAGLSGLGLKAALRGPIDPPPRPPVSAPPTAPTLLPSTGAASARDQATTVGKGSTLSRDGTVSEVINGRPTELKTFSANPYNYSLVYKTIEPYSAFTQQLGYLNRNLPGVAYTAPKNATDLNALQKLFNDKAPAQHKIMTEWYDAPGEIDNLVYIKNWSQGKMPLDGGHDQMVHVLAHAAVPREVAEKSIRNHQRIQELLDKLDVGPYPRGLRNALADDVVSNLDALYRPELGMDLTERFLNWQIFVGTMSLSGPRAEKILASYPSLQEQVRATARSLERLTEDEARVYYQQMMTKLGAK